MLLEWKLKKIRLTEQKKLNETNLYLYKSITTYIQNGGLRQIEKEEVLQQIMDMILQTQIENKPVDFIVGNDYEEFCKSIIEEYVSCKSKTYKVLSFIQRFFIDTVLIIIIMGILGCIINKSFGFGITVDQVIIANVISLIIIPIARKIRQETSALTSIYSRIFTANGKNVKAMAFMLIVIEIIRIFLGKVYGSQIFNSTLTLYPGMIYITIMIVFIAGIEVYKRLQSNM